MESPDKTNGTDNGSLFLLRMDKLVVFYLVTNFLYAWSRHGFKSSALFTAGVFLSGVVGNTVGGVISDKVLKMTGNLVAARRNVILFSFISVLFLLVPVINTDSLLIMTICLSVAFFCLELTIGPIWAVPMDITPKYVGIASGLMNAGSAVAGIISPIVFGIIIDKTGNWSLPFYGSVALLIIGIFLTFFMRPDKSL